jgi:hypothetical protein
MHLGQRSMGLRQGCTIRGKFWLRRPGPVAEWGVSAAPANERARRVPSAMGPAIPTFARDFGSGSRFAHLASRLNLPFLLNSAKIMVWPNLPEQLGKELKLCVNDSSVAHGCA